MMFNKLMAKKLAVVLTLVGTTVGLAPMTVAQSVDLVDKDPIKAMKQVLMEN